MSTLLDIKGLVTSFDTDSGWVRAVDGISFSVEKGKTVGLVGESGCGKTVTAMSIIDLLPNHRDMFSKARLISKDVISAR